KVDYIFLSHFDVDHFAGLIGLFSTLQLQRRDKPITLVAPKGIRDFIEWNFNFANIDLGFEVNYVELEEGFEHERVVDVEEFYVEARPLNHNSFCIGYRFQEKDRPGKVDADKAEAKGISEDWQYKDLKAGKDVELDDGTLVKSQDIVGHPRPGDSFAYITDTRYSPNAVKLGMNTNILLHEATFGENLSDKAEETGHSTAVDAARVANEAQTKLLVISHFSARYTNPFVLLREARQHFFPAWLATEMRPIFTDPAHEKGIITPKVYIKEVDKKSGSGKKRYSKGGKNTDDKQKRFRKRKNYKGRSSKNNDDSRSKKSSDNRRKKKNDNQNDSSRKPRHITPRTPFDDFNRF
ncbi:MAG: MBL fold metallo-hydrolase, partial [Balneolaceae bacterium]